MIISCIIEFINLILYNLENIIIFSNNISKFSAEDFIESKIDVLRLYSILMKICSDRLGGGINREKSKSLTSEKMVTEKEKLYLALYSFKYSRFDQKDEIENKSLDDDIKFFSNIFNFSID